MHFFVVALLPSTILAHFTGLILAHGSDAPLGANHYKAGAVPDFAHFTLGKTELPLRLQPSGDIHIDLNSVDKKFRPFIWYHRGGMWTRLMLADQGGVRVPLVRDQSIEQLLVLIANGNHQSPPKLAETLNGAELISSLLKEHGEAFGMGILKF